MSKLHQVRAEEPEVRYVYVNHDLLVTVQGLDWQFLQGLQGVSRRS